jgi:hypothetical protein
MDEGLTALHGMVLTGHAAGIGGRGGELSEMRGIAGASRRAGLCGTCWVRSAASPHGLQNDESPTCDISGRRMMFVVQLEQGHDHRTSVNFGGGGCGCGFPYEPCGTAAFLWQR